jgi:hypothetical protein
LGGGGGGGGGGGERITSGIGGEDVMVSMSPSLIFSLSVLSLVVINHAYLLENIEEKTRKQYLENKGSVGIFQQQHKEEDGCGGVRT